MRKCLVIASTLAEIEPFIRAYREDPAKWSGKMEVDVLITGVGLTATTYILTRQISVKRPGIVIQAGIAGSMEQGIKPGTVLAIRSDRVGDEMVVEKNKIRTISDLGLRDKNEPPYQNTWLKNPHEDLIGLTGLSTARAITVNQITTDKKSLEHFRKNYRASIESMEGAALHYVCLSESIPFVQLRAVSNYAGERDKKKWKLKRSIKQLNKTLLDLLDTLSASKPSDP